MALSISKLKKSVSRQAKLCNSNPVRSSIKQLQEDLDVANRIASKSQLTEKDVAELAEKIDAGMAKRWKKLKRAIIR